MQRFSFDKHLKGVMKSVMRHCQLAKHCELTDLNGVEISSHSKLHIQTIEKVRYERRWYDTRQKLKP